MGNSQSESSQGKPPDKNMKTLDRSSSRSRVLCNTPYLTAMFKVSSYYEESATYSSRIHVKAFISLGLFYAICNCRNCLKSLIVTVTKLLRESLRWCLR